MRHSAPRLLFELLRPDHAELLFPLLADERVYQFLGSELPETVEQLVRDYSVRAAGIPVSELDEQWLNFAVIEQATGRLIGQIEATRVGAWAEVAYLFGVDYWGQGFATEAMAWLHRFLAEETPVVDCWAAVLPGNTRSSNLLARLGYAEVANGWPAMRSYDAGDLVFHRPFTDLSVHAPLSAASRSSAPTRRPSRGSAT